MSASTDEVAVERHGFQAEVSRLLHLMVHSVYSEREVFLRELISNASDACDRLRYLAQTAPDLLNDASGHDFRIDIVVDKDAGTLAITDNGIGMNRGDLIDNLGTIARSGTSAFMAGLTGDAKKDINLIGQFGVGFYSVFMVADRVTVLSRKAGEAEAWVWESAGDGEFSVQSGERSGRGATITLHVREDAKDFLDQVRLETVVRKYSDHIAVPITLALREGGKEGLPLSVNKGSALWTRSKGDITDEQYKEFYHHVGHAFDDPYATIHYKAEGALEYTVLLFIPGMRPFDLFDPARRSRVKLFVKRVFITDECEEILPAYLRFLKGVIDSEDLPLNISREMLQHNPVLAKIKKAVTNRILGELKKKAEADAAGYANFIELFGAVLKEGIYEDHDRRAEILRLARFRSTAVDGWTSLDDYIARMKPQQTAIYYLTGDDLDAVKRSPHLEGFKARGVEVLLMSDPVDDFWLTVMPDYEGKPLRSVTRGASDLQNIAATENEKQESAAPEGELSALIAALKENLKEAVKDVRATDRLTDSAVCLVADEGDMDMHIARLLRQNKQLMKDAPRILELNPQHPLIKALSARAATPGGLDALADIALLLLDQARLLEGEPIPDPSAFAKRLSDALMRAVG
ncbi:MAG: molecular chaperone HtpG [Sphingomonadales bacterium]|nr:molecular chaperone HtpG [Sphingomonadales bacterium]